ncbi:hypothetical protein [Moraxella lacunata]|uniref:hypothetical protein n=1 Tax=Moraxella lacunata TaxID=477 RepID=UPI003EE1DF49
MSQPREHWQSPSRLSHQNCLGLPQIVALVLRPARPHHGGMTAPTDTAVRQSNHSQH